ncbi:MAG: tellurite resistance TerB family protein [Rubrivivax sp.]|nr:tellurite resistance TerB family protein [Rubrivivax sp.]
MNFSSLLDQVLKSGMDAAGGVAKAGRGDMGKYATGAAVGGVLGLLLGNQRGRRIGGKALKLGSVAAIGALAYKVWQDHQAQQAKPLPPAAGVPQAPSALPAPEQQGQALLKAMIAAAKSDGHFDDRERELLQTELQRLQVDDGLRRWVDDEIRRPIDPADVARAAATPEQRAELYLASVLVVDETTPMERAYLDALARQMQLAPALQQDLERRAAGA